MMTRRRRQHRFWTGPVLAAAVLTGVQQTAWALPPAVRLAQTTAITLKPRVAVMEFRAINVPSVLSAATAETLRSALIQLQRITVIEREQIEQVLREQQFNRSGLVEGNSAVELGRLLGANAIVVGSVTRFGETYLINARALDATTGEALAASQVTTTREDEIPAQLQQVAMALFPDTTQAASPQPADPVPTVRATPLPTPASVAVEPVTPPLDGDQRPAGLLKSEALLKGLLVPSWGEFYAQEPVRGWLSLAAVGLGLGLTMVTSTTVLPSTLEFGSSMTFVNRPLFVPGLLLIGLGWFGSAVDAWAVTKETPAAAAAAPTGP